MYALRAFPRLAYVRSFHSPFVVLNAINHPTSPPPLPSTPAPAPAPVYEKQHDSSPEPHLSSSGTRTYVVSEPDPSDTPYQVPSGAYPASASYLTTAPIAEGVHTSTSSSQPHPSSVRTSHHKEPGVGQNAGARNTAASGEMGHTVGPMGAPGSKPGRS